MVPLRGRRPEGDNAVVARDGGPSCQFVRGLDVRTALMRLRMRNDGGLGLAKTRF